jgi:hypothetical protein
MTIKMYRASFVALATTFLLLISVRTNAGDVFVLGPIEQVVLGPNPSIQVLGQRYKTEKTTRLFARGKLLPGNSFGGLSEGMYVSIEGELSTDGSQRARTITIAPARYVPGSSPVMLSGVVDVVDRLTGFIRVGNLDIDLTSVMALSQISLEVGAPIQVAGIQPGPNTLLAAQEFHLSSIEGTGKQSIEGTGKQSIEGTGKQSIEGTGKQSIEGTGK